MTKAQKIQDNIFYSILNKNEVFLDESTEEFYTQASVIALLTALVTLGMLLSSI